MLLLALRSLRAHPLRSLLTALAIALGVAMMLSASVIGQAASQSAERLSQANATDAVIQSGPAFNTLLFQALLALVGVIVLFTAGFVIANAFGMAVTARLKELGALRTLGMMRRQVLNLVLIEAGLLGLAGAVGGLLLGLGLAGLALRLTGMGGNLSVPVWALIASPLIGFTVTVGAALLPALQASRISPLQALKPESESRPTPYASRSALLPASFILLTLVGLGLYAFIGKPDVLTALIVLLPAMVILLVLVALLMPALVGSVANFARPWLVRWVGPTAGRLAADNLHRHPTRAALTAGAMTAGLTMMIAMSGLLTTFLKGGLLTFVTIAREDRVVLFNLSDPAAFRAENSLQMFIEAPPLNPELLARLQALADKGQLELGRLDAVAIPAELSSTPGSPGIFMDPEVFVRRGSFDFSEGNAEDALRYFAHGPAVLLMPLTAQRLNMQVGDSVSIQTLTGPVDFTVAGVGADTWVMTAFSFTDGQKFFDVTDPSFMSIFVREGQNKEAVLKQVDDIVADYDLASLDFKNLLSQFFRIGDQIIGLMNALLLLTVLVAALGVVNTMVINVTERQREIGMLRAIGTTQRQVRQMVVAEGATLGLFAVFVAVLLSLVIVSAYILLLSPNGLQSLGFRLNWETFQTGFLPALPVMAQATLAALIFAPLIAGLAAYYPAKQAAAMDVITATRDVGVGLIPTQTQREEGYDEDRNLPTSFTLFLLTRVIQEQRTRFLLSVLAVVIGAATTIASDYIGAAVQALILQNEDIHTIGAALGEIASWIKMVGVSVSLAVGFLIFNTFAMSFTQRRQQLGTLRTLGTTRAQIIRLALAEAALIGVLGTGVGLVTGQLIGRGFIAFLRAASDFFNTFVERDTSLDTYALAIGLGLGVPLLAMLLPALNAARVSPLVALKAPESTRAGARSSRPYLVLLLLAPLLLLLRPPNLAPPLDMYVVALLGALWLGLLALVLPATLEAFAALSRAFLQRAGATGLLMADNLRRAQARTLVTAVTLTVGITLIITLTGALAFYGQELMRPKLQALSAQRIIIITAFDMQAGLAAYNADASFRLLPTDITDLQAEFAERAFIVPTGFVNVRELSGLGDVSSSFMLSPVALRDQLKDVYFTFTEGDWEHAFPLMEKGCAVLVAPFVARRNNAQLYDTITVTSPLPEQNLTGLADLSGLPRRKVECVIAGIGELISGITIISEAARDDFDRGSPFILTLQAQPGTDFDTLFADLETFTNARGLHLLEVDDFSAVVFQVLDVIPVLFNGILFFAVLAAALGVFNATLISLHERRRELGQLRAVGMTRKQATWVVVGEALLIGVFGAGLSLIAGAGFILIITLTFGGNAMGVVDFPIYAATFRTLGAGMVNGIAALVIAPTLCALAAYLPARAMLRGAAIDTLNPEQTQPITRQHIVGFLNRGSIQTRFVLGTSLLLLVVLASLIQVVVAHARNYFVNQLRDSGAAMVGWNATMVELSLPPDAQTIDLDQLAGQRAQGQSFDADAMLRFRSLIDDMTEGGLEQFVITDRDNVVVVSFDQRDMGDTLDPIANPQRTSVREATPEGERVPRIVAEAPLHNNDGDFVGSLRMTLRMTEVQDFLDRVRNLLWAAGAVIVILGLLLSWALSLPFSRAAQRLGAQANRVSAGDYSLFTVHSSRFTVSIRTRLTLLMTLLVSLLVGGMGLLVIPIERDQLERTTKDGILTVVQWIGDFMSGGLPSDFSDLGDFDLAQMLNVAQNLDFGKLQELTEQTRGQSIVYLTIANTDGEIVLADKLALMGEPGPTVTEPTVTDSRVAWRDEAIWIASTPLRQGQDGEQLGTLSVGFSRASIESFLSEAQNLFWLTGLIAVLAGLLLAQALGGAVAAPAEELATGARRVAHGDLSVKFGGVETFRRNVSTADELSQLAYAFNQMVVGLREREKLRDLFGRYVSREVSEAVLSGRVSLKGERKTITCLYVDMRGSTTFAEKYQPEEVMAALNEYFEVIILATEAHGGIVNRFVGDEAVCVFGAPTEVRDHAERAVQAALSMREGLAYVNQKRTALGLPTLKFGMGLNTGEVTAGATGSEERQEYTVIGDAMNAGARIQALNKTFPDYDILLSEFTQAALGPDAGQYGFVDLGPVEIRGKSKAVKVLGLVGRVGK